MVLHWDKTRNGRCPDCGTKEDAAHLMMCPSRSRTALLKETVEDLERWMKKSELAREIKLWVPKYILMRNMQTLSSFKGLLDNLRKFAAEQDAVGWREFTEGRISKGLVEEQEEHLSQEVGRMRIIR